MGEKGWLPFLFLNTGTCLSWGSPFGIYFRGEKSPSREVLGQEMGERVFFLFVVPLGISSTTRIRSAGSWVWDLSSGVVVEGRLPTARCCHLRPVVRNHLVLANQGPQSSRNPPMYFPILHSLSRFSEKYHPRFLH